MNKGILITLPESDDVTKYLTVFSKSIIQLCNQRLINIVQLTRENVTRKIFESKLKKLNYNMIIFNGHGSPTLINGHKNENIIKLGINESILTDRIIYARSCWAASGIGNACMKLNKNGCFIGYNLPFMFIINNNWVANPIKDNIARIFFDTSNMVPIGIIKGHSVRESNENSKKSMLKAINKALERRDGDSKTIAEILWNNYNGQVIIGNINAQF